MIPIKFNNTHIQISQSNLDQFLKANNCINGFAVAINRKFIPSSQFATTTINPNDDIEIIRPMQGG